MPPRRGQRKSVSTTSASGSQVPQIEDVSQQISDAVSEWDSKGHNALLELLVFRVDASSSTTLSSVPLSHVFASLLASGLDPSALAILLSSLIEGFPEDVREERTEMLGEALADVIEVMEEDKEDRDDLGKEDGEMEVDDEGKKWKGGEKGLEVFKLLLVSFSSRSRIGHTELILRRSRNIFPLISLIFCSVHSSSCP